MGWAPALRAGADGEEKHGLVCLSGGPILVQDGSFSGFWSLLTHSTYGSVCEGCGSPPFFCKSQGLVGILVVYLPGGLTLDCEFTGADL